ncbi:MAG: signal peptidase I, partial [Clostridia bacterium]|nr:signal peptidase I [Clostridia bacterium]
ESDPDESGEKDVYVGRIIAAPGDTLDISENGAVIVNGNTLVEQDIRIATPVYGEFVEYPVRLGENEFFVLADDRLNGMDSRYIGAVEKKDVIGSVITIVRRHDL